MANKPKKGLDYFPIDVNIFSDLKVRKLIRYQGGQSVTVYAYLLCNIYKDGYYIKWDNELPFVISEATGFNEAYIQEVIKCCFSVGVFSKRIFDAHKIITSKGIQERYSEISRLAKRKFQIDEFNLINSEEKEESSELLNNYSEEMVNNSEELTQSKVKEIKAKEKKGNRAKALVAGEPATDKPTRKDYEKIIEENTGKELKHVVTVLKNFLARRPEFLEPYRDYWNIAVEKTNLPQLKAVSDSRNQKLKVRIKEDGFDFVSIIGAIHRSHRLKMESSWFSFDWIFENDKNYLRILEGNYNN